MLAPQFRDGVWLIELATVADGAGVDAAVASVFMLQPQPGRTWRQVVVDGLLRREVLLVIDNCEHVLDETAALVEALAQCASVRVLVTTDAVTVEGLTCANAGPGRFVRYHPSELVRDDG